MIGRLGARAGRARPPHARAARASGPGLRGARARGRVRRARAPRGAAFGWAFLSPCPTFLAWRPPRAPRARPRARAPPDACSPPARPRFFETFSYLPPLTDAEILKQVQYLLKINASPCVEFAFPADSYAGAGYSTGMDSRSSSGYYTNRYWAMWKLPMYGATDADQVLQECKKCAKAFPNAFVRLCGFDAIRQARRPPLPRPKPFIRP